MRVVIAGSSGVIGSAVAEALRLRGDEVVRLVRPASPGSGVAWDPATGTIDTAGIDGADAVVNLAGRSIGARRWTSAEKRLLWDSRVDSTSLLAETVAVLERPPSLFLNASAVGYYGDGGDAVLTEESSAGSGFLSDLTVAWEAATAPASSAGCAVALLRSGIVLSLSGGALGRLLAPFGPRWLSPFRWGVGGRVGRGRQWWSWITLADEVRAILHILDNGLSGPINLVSEQPVTNREFTRALGRALRRPTAIPIPEFVLRAILGSGLARSLVLEGQRVVPAALLRSGFEFTTSDVEEGLWEALGG